MNTEIQNRLPNLILAKFIKGLWDMWLIHLFPYVN
jgi:hypothetical protein